MKRRIPPRSRWDMSNVVILASPAPKPVERKPDINPQAYALSMEAATLVGHICAITLQIARMVPVAQGAATPPNLEKPL